MLKTILAAAIILSTGISFDAPAVETESVSMIHDTHQKQSEQLKNNND